MNNCITHQELVKKASKWLKNTIGCPVILTEHVGGFSETPDAIGWKHGHFSILVECKCSKSDFYKDKKKIWRQPLMEEDALGTCRYYLFPEGLFNSYEKIPKKWGILELKNNRIKIIKESDKFNRSMTGLRAEISLLWSKLRKINKCS